MLRSSVILLLFTLVFVIVVVASPVPQRRQSVTLLSTTQVTTYKPYIFYAAVAYCQPQNTLAWNCGANCQANSAFKPIASGGDGDAVQFWFVGYDPTLDTVIVSHQGSDFTKVEPLLTDVNAMLGPLDSELFPGVPTSVQVHRGFRNEQAKTATQIYGAVLQTLPYSTSKTVTVVGHSLGAALALLDALYLRLALPSSVTVKVISLGSPRVGNPYFAEFVDSKLPGKVTHISNRQDMISILPGKFLGYAHSDGEVHINEDNTWVSCPGHDNPDEQCIVGHVASIFKGSIHDHLGPYGDIMMDC